MNKFYQPNSAVPAVFSLIGLSVLAAMLSSCGGNGSTSSGTAGANGAVATGVTNFTIEPATAASSVEAAPTFHLAPVVLSAPDTTDMLDASASARRAPAVNSIPAELQGLSSKRLTLQKMFTAQGNAAYFAGTAKPMSASSVITYTPAQIRSAYGMAAVPATGSSLSASQAAALGAGQTIYIVDAYSDPNVAAELATFNQTFGLPSCSALSITTTTSLPLAAASTSGCQLAVVYSTTSSTRTTSAPAYNAGWATEITLDVQWAHATAPLARIVLIEAPNSSTSALQAAVNLANAMGPGVVSMSFGAAEFSQSNSLDGSFSAANMTYLAATGDNGTGVQWPSVSTKVIAVGGTSLSNISSTARSETAWADTGGGISAYIALPSYQTSAVPGLGNPGRRAVADVSFNADPNYGQYLAVMAPGSSSVNWVSAGGTSLATPQWAGLIAVANALRAYNGQGKLGDLHTTLYSQIGTNATNFANDFYDVRSGADGSCTSCSARSGYDEPTGLGTPKVAAMLVQPAGAISNPPVVTPASITGVANVALSFTANVTASDAVAYSLSGQPSGMAVSSSGAVTWSKPVAGTYKVTINAKDNVSGQSGSGLYTITIAADVAPKITAQSVTGKAGTALSFTPVVTAQDAVTWSLQGQPAGMTISAAGAVTWAAPIQGNYSVTVVAKDSATGLSGSAVFSISIGLAPLPVVPISTSGSLSLSASTMTGKSGAPLSGTITIVDTNESWLSVSIANAPIGMSFGMSGLTITANWSSALAGTYKMVVTVTDSNGQTTTLNVPVTVTN
jgi:subtilase family serine protease